MFMVIFFLVMFIMCFACVFILVDNYKEMDAFTVFIVVSYSCIMMFALFDRYGEYVTKRTHIEIYKGNITYELVNHNDGTTSWEKIDKNKDK